MMEETVNRIMWYSENVPAEMVT